MTLSPGLVDLDFFIYYKLFVTTQSNGVILNMKQLLLASAIAFSAMLPGQTHAQSGPKSINTGGPAGAYHSTFCPPIPNVLANAYFQGYQCTPSAGTVDNIARVLSNPTSIGFAQLDVYASEAASKPDEFKRLQVIRTDIACEGLWMITKNPDLNFGTILGLSRRIQFILPAPTSGSTASFNYLRTIDPDGLGRVPDSNITHVRDATEVIKRINASNQGEVGFFVQFADPRNSNIQLIVENKLRIIPVISREIIRAKVGEQNVYNAETFTLANGKLFGIGGSPIMATTACTPVALFTGAPGAFSNRNHQDDAQDMIQRLQQINRAQLMPKDSFIQNILTSATRLSQDAVNQAIAGVESVRQAIESK